MQTSNANQNFRSEDPGWYFLAEYSLSGFTSDNHPADRLTSVLLSQTMQGLGIPIECIENIKTALKSFATETLVLFKPGGVEFPRRIRIFCQKKMIKEEMEGGWGYFLIENGAGFPAHSSSSSNNSIDLYLYKEGE